MAKRGFWLLTGLVALTVLVITYLHYTYFFNPITFRHSGVTYLPWQCYKNPLQLEYAVLDEDGWKMTTTSDQTEIDLVFQELRCGQDAGNNAVPQAEGRQIWFAVRRLGDGAILLSAEGWESSTVCTVNDLTAVTLSERLQRLLQERIQEARSVAAKRQSLAVGT
jgi:hypothetical protein